MNYILRDYNRLNFLPFTFTRPVAEIRIGIFTIREKWDHYLKNSTSYLTEKYLSGKFPLKTEKKNILINSCVLPNAHLIKEIEALDLYQQIKFQEHFIAACVPEEMIKKSAFEDFKTVSYEGDLMILENLWDIFLKNDKAIAEDFKLLKNFPASEKINSTNRITAGENIYIAKNAQVNHSIINASAGPVYIGENAEVMEGCMIRGPFSLGNNSVLKMGTRIYGATTIGPHCKAAGEISNSVMFGFSSKAHDGFLGNSVVGEWCNLGADTNNSNLKNNYSNVKIWSYAEENYRDTGLQFCGLFMGDHSKCGINTMFNTGTVVGVSANIFGSDFPPKYIPSFSWGSAQGFQKFELDKAVDVATQVYKRRDKVFNNTEREILKYLYLNSSFN